MTDKKAPKPPAKPKDKPHGGPPQNKADHAAFKRGDRFVSKPMRIKH